MKKELRTKLSGFSVEKLEERKEFSFYCYYMKEQPVRGDEGAIDAVPL